MTRIRVTSTGEEYSPLLLLEPMLLLVVVIIGALFGLVFLEGFLVYLALAVLVASPFALVWAAWYDRHDKRARFHCPVCLGNFSRHELNDGAPG